LGTVLPYASVTVTATVNGMDAVVDVVDGTMTNRDGAAGLTVMLPLVPRSQPSDAEALIVTVWAV
jgi:hypothetical protein